MAKINAQIGLKVGNVSGAMNQLSGKIRQGLAPLKNMQNAAAKLQASLSPVVAVAKAAAVGFAAAAAGAAAISIGLKKAFDLGGELSDLSAQTGIAVDQLAILQQAFVNNGMSADAAAPAVNRLQRIISGMGSEEGEEALNALGLSMSELEAKNPTDQLSEVGAAINALESPAQRAGAAMSIFGRSGGQMLTLFADSGAMGTASKQLGSQAKILEENAAMFDRISDGLGAAGKKIQGFFVGMAAEIGPVLEPWLAWFEGIDLAKLGQEFGKVVAAFMQALTDGSIWEIMGQSAMIAFSNAVNFLWKALQSVGMGLGQLIYSAFELGVEALSILTTPEYWRAVGNQLMAIVHKFSAVFYQAFAGILNMIRPVLSKIGLGGMVDSAVGGLESMAAQQSAAGDRSQATADDLTGPMREKMMAAFATEIQNISAAMAEGFDEAGNAIDTSAMEDRMNELLDQAFANVEILKGESKARDTKKKGAGWFEDEGAAGKSGSSLRAERLQSMGGGMGLMVKNVLARDPLLSESQKQTKLLNTIATKLDRTQSTQPSGARLARFALA